MFRFPVLVVLAALGALSIASPASAQVLGPTLDSGEAELGYTYKWYHRDLEPKVSPETEWEVGALYFRYGAYDWVTLMLEAGTWPIDNEVVPTHDYTRYTVGGGLAVRFWEFRGMTFSAAGRYSETMDYDESESHFHQRSRNVTAGVQAEHTYRLNEQRLAFWGALLYVFDDGRTYLWGTRSTLQFESRNNFGVGAGADVLLFDVLGGFAHLVYADYVQARLGVFIRVSRL